MKKQKQKQSHKLYACGTIPWEICPSNAGMIEFYNSPEACSDDRPCSDSCGIVEYDVCLSRIVQPGRQERGTPAAVRAAREKKFIALADEISTLVKKRTRSRDLQQSALTWALSSYKLRSRRARHAARGRNR